jgi:hypothetical protein
MSVFKTILALAHNSINNCEIGHLGSLFRVSTYLNNTVQLEHDMGDEMDQSGNVIEKKKVEEKEDD